MAPAYPLTGLLALAHAGVFFVAGWAYGQLLVPAAVRDPATRSLVAIALGTGLLGYVAFALGLVGLLRPHVLLGVLAGGVVLALVRHRSAPARSPAIRLLPGGTFRDTLPPGLPRWSAAVAALAGGFALLGALLPEIEYDAIWYHLAFPLRYLRSGRLLDFPCEHMSPVPQHAELLYAYGLLLEDARAAKLIHAGFGVLAALWTAVLAARLVGRRWAVVAAALFVTAPTVLWEMTTAYNELPLTFLAIGAIALLVDWRARGERRLLLLAAALVGLGLAGKHLAFLLLAPMAAGILLGPRAARERDHGRRAADAALFAGLALAVALPWYLRAWVYTGNPLFPMFYDLLTAAGVQIERWDVRAQAGWEAAMARYGHGRSLRDLLLLPWRMTWDGGRYAGSLGPVWPMFLPLLPLVWRRLGQNLRLLAALAVIYLALWASPFSSFQVRYLVPVVPVLGILVAAVIRHLRPVLRRAGWRGGPRVLGGAVVAVLVLNLPPLFLPLADARSWTPSIVRSMGPGAWSTALGLRPADDYLRARVRPYGAVQYMNRELPPEARVVTFAGAAHFYARPELLHDYSRCVIAGTWGTPAGQEARAFATLRDGGVTHILWERERWRWDTGEAGADPAVATAAFRERYARRVYEDRYVELDELMGAEAPQLSRHVVPQGERR